MLNSGQARAATAHLFSVTGMECFKRLTLIVQDGQIAKVFYPVFPPDSNVVEVLAWLRNADD